MVVGFATHHAEIEQKLTDLLQKVGYLLATKDSAEATEFLAVREYGLALEAIAEGLRAQQQRIDPSIADYIVKLARDMEIESRPFVKALST
jgi:hypothetical protein